MDTTDRTAACRLVGTLAIRDVLSCHSRGIDRADAALLLEAYHPDATVDYGFFVGAASEFAPLICDSQRASPVSLHRSGAAWIALDGDEGVSETTVIACAEDMEDDTPLQHLVLGRYLDRHSLRDGRWGLTHRTYVMDGNINRPGASAWAAHAAPLANAVPRGAHADADAGYALLALGRAWLQQPGDTEMHSPSERQLDEALAKIAVHDLLMAYARGVDRADTELLESIFHPEARVISGVFNGSGREFAQVIAGYVKLNLDRCFHSIANEWVEVSGDRAIGEAYVIATMTAGGTDTVSGGRYIDEFERVDGRWLIRSHTFVADWNMSMPSSYSEQGLYSTLSTRGCYGREDPVYAHWASL